MVTVKDRAAWAHVLKYQRFSGGVFAIITFVWFAAAATKFWMTSKGWVLLTPLEKSRLLGEFYHPDWTSSRRGLEILVRDSFLSGVRNLVLAVLSLFALFLQQRNFAYNSRLWSHIAMLEARTVDSGPRAD